eukprot:TRINITY_DN23011_c0_g1_i1.p1 TRINITY_DN23011_c0_g1~~TRINITY_DN23011_c0_g1_i1.p1  ORF type:complete len:411 (+),score=112.28 TRINITY_DN23011_c0_g1_i1:71-1234(+)
MADSGFYAVYCLECLHPRWPGESYIGFTVDPERRIRQHNGELQHGAHETRRRRPWRMVWCVHGFPSKILALQFEWAWQHPKKAKGIKVALEGVRGALSKVHHKLWVMRHLLQCAPWKSFVLRLHVFDDERFAHYSKLLPRGSAPALPDSLSLEHGDFSALQQYMHYDSTAAAAAQPGSHHCSLCAALVRPDEAMSCLAPDCTLLAHPICLAHTFASTSIVPTGTAACVLCGAELAWHAVVQRSKELIRKREQQARAAAKQHVQQLRKQYRQEEAQRASQLTQHAPPLPVLSQAPPPPPPLSQAAADGEDAVEGESFDAMLARYAGNVTASQGSCATDGDDGQCDVDALLARWAVDEEDARAPSEQQVLTQYADDLLLTLPSVRHHVR